MIERDTVLVFTGAGVSADSGVLTFRDNGGFWGKYKAEDVATLEAFNKNPQLVWGFYKMRHDELMSTLPNEAHHAIAKLECIVKAQGFEFILVTQNVDRLHQKAGSKEVFELHGNLHDIKCSSCDFIASGKNAEIYWALPKIPKCPACSGHLRPDIVWFGEIPDETSYSKAMEAVEHCHSVLVVGTSLNVYPAANIANKAAIMGAMTYESNLSSEMNTGNFENYHFVKGRAAVTVPEICSTIHNNLITSKRK